MFKQTYYSLFETYDWVNKTPQKVVCYDPELLTDSRAQPVTGTEPVNRLNIEKFVFKNSKCRNVKFVIYVYGNVKTFLLALDPGH